MKKIAQYKLPNRTLFMLVVASSLFIAVISVPFAATVDGIVYISNAKSLFTPDFQTQYIFYREPVYPLLLKLIHILGDSVTLIVLIQAALLSVASCLAFLSLKIITRKNSSNLLELIIVCLGTWSPYFLAFSGVVLQQSLFVFELAVYGFLLAVSFLELTFKSRIGIIASTFFWLLVTTWTSVGWIYLSLFPASAILSINFINVLKQYKQRRIGKLVSVIAILISICLSLVAGRLLFGGWEHIKAANSFKTKAPTAVIEPIDSVPYVDLDLKSNWERATALIGIGERDIYVSEQKLIVEKIQFSGHWPRFYYDAVWQKKNLRDYPAGYFSVANPGYKFSDWYGNNLKFANWMYSFLFLLSIAVTISAIASKKWKIVIYSGIPFTFILVYLASNTPIDRYGLPAYPFALAIVAVGVSSFAGKLSSRLMIISRRLRP